MEQAGHWDKVTALLETQRAASGAVLGPGGIRQQPTQHCCSVMELPCWFFGTKAQPGLLQTQQTHTEGEVRQKGETASLDSGLAEKQGSSGKGSQNTLTDAQPSLCYPRLCPTGTNRLCPLQTSPVGQGRASSPGPGRTRPSFKHPQTRSTCPAPCPGLPLSASRASGTSPDPSTSPIPGKATDNVCVAPTFSCVLHFLLPLVLFLRVRVLVHCSFPNSISFLLAVPQISQFPR